MSQLTPTIVRPNAGKVFKAFNEEVTLHLGGAETGGQFCMFTEITPPGGGPPPHYHLLEDEWFLLLQGRMEFFLNDNWQEVPVGTAVFAPRQEVHTFRNPGDVPSTMLIHTMPAGFDEFFARCAEEFANSSTPDMQRILEIGTEHGIHFVDQ